jgi:Trp operon repressor
MEGIIDSTQTAFVPGRDISDNVLSMLAYTDLDSFGPSRVTLLSKLLTQMYEAPPGFPSDKIFLGPFKSHGPLPPPAACQCIVSLDTAPGSMFDTVSSLSSSSKPASSTLGNPKPKDWLLDSGASHHMTGDLQIMFDVKPCHMKFNTSNGPTVSTRVGRAHITFECGTEETLEEVYYLPGSQTNLISEDMLTLKRSDPEQEYVITRYRGVRTLMQGTNQRIIPTRSLSSSTTIVRTMCEVSQPPVACATTKQTAELWHSRLVGFKQVAPFS